MMPLSNTAAALPCIMTQPTLNFLACADSAAGHRMAYWQWGPAQAGHTVVCVHGLSRQGRDFDCLARALVQQARMVLADEPVASLDPVSARRVMDILDPPPPPPGPETPKRRIGFNADKDEKPVANARKKA